jgi:GNAT superfamily N-acetyltransferase
MGRLTAPRSLIAEDDRQTFDCERDSLNAWFRRHAWVNQVNDVSRTSVIFDESERSVIGFVSLSAGQIARGLLPKASQRNRPDPVPAILLGQLAVDRRRQGQGCARSLIQYALLTSLKFSDEVGCVGVLTQPLDDEVRSFYAAFGFVELSVDPSRRMMVRIAELRRLMPNLT